VLSNGTNWAWQLDGLITAEYTGNAIGQYTVSRDLILHGFAGVQALNGTINGEGDGEFLENFIVIVNGLLSFLICKDCLSDAGLAVDFEFYSENGLGAIQGQGYLYRIAGE